MINRSLEEKGLKLISLKLIQVITYNYSTSLNEEPFLSNVEFTWITKKNGESY